MRRMRLVPAALILFVAAPSFAQEWVEYNLEGVSTGIVPSEAMRRGDFSELLDPANSFYGRRVVINDA